MLEGRNKMLISKNAEILFPHVHFDFELITFEDVVAVGRILYGTRATANDPIRIAFGTSGGERNTVQFVFRDHPSDFKPQTGWKEVDVANMLARYKIQAKAYMSEECQSSILVASYHAEARYLLAMLPRLTPWMFKKNPPTEWEKKFVYSLLDASDHNFVAMLNEYAQRENLKAKLEGAQLTAFVDGLLDAKVVDLEREAEQIRNELYMHEEAVRELLTRQTDVFHRILGVRAGHSGDAIDEFKTVFLSNPNCHLLSANKTTLVFGVSGFITNFNETTYLALSRELRSILYDCWSELTCSRKVLQKIFDELFLGDRYRIKTYGAVELNLSTGTVALPGRRISGEYAQNAIPNPHMVHYHCMGGFGQLYNKAISAGDYAEVLDIAFSEVQNVNWADTTVVRKFASDICVDWRNYPCIWDKQEKVFIAPHELARRKEAETVEQ